MSEMTPVARVDGRWSDGRAMIRTLEAGANMPLSTELYTSEQIAEAVAAERERCAKVCEGMAEMHGGVTGFFLKKASSLIRSAEK